MAHTHDEQDHDRQTPEKSQQETDFGVPVLLELGRKAGISKFLKLPARNEPGELVPFGAVEESGLGPTECLISLRVPFGKRCGEPSPSPDQSRREKHCTNKPAEGNDASYLVGFHIA